MINRNSYNKIKKDDKGKRFIEDTFFPHFKGSETDIYIYTVDGDSLDKIAREYYGNEHYWFIIADVNNLVSMNLKDGIQLRIPDLSRYLEKFKEENL